TRWWRGRATGFHNPVFHNPTGARTGLDAPPGVAAAATRAFQHLAGGTGAKHRDNTITRARTRAHIQRLGDAGGIANGELATAGSRWWRGRATGLHDPVFHHPAGARTGLDAPPGVAAAAARAFQYLAGGTGAKHGNHTVARARAR